VGVGDRPELRLAHDNLYLVALTLSYNSADGQGLCNGRAQLISDRERIV
jgi:hypothetical protein